MENTPIKRLYYSISEVSKLVDEEQYVLRYWETEFEQLRPQKNRAGNRVYNENDIEVIRAIQHLLRIKRHTIEGAKEHLRNMQLTVATKSTEPEQKADEEHSSVIQSAANDDHTDQPSLQHTYHHDPRNITHLGTVSHLPSTVQNDIVVEQPHETRNEDPTTEIMDTALPDHIAESVPYTFSHAATVHILEETTHSAPMLSISVPPLPSVTENTHRLDQSETAIKESDTQQTAPSTFDHMFSVESWDKVWQQDTTSAIPLNTADLSIEPLNTEQQTSPLPGVQFTREELLSMRDTLRQLLHLLDKPEQSISSSDAHSEDTAPPETVF